MDQANGASSPAPSQPAASSSQARPTDTSTTAEPSTKDIAATFPRTSLLDTGDTPRPRDARTIHIILSSLGVTAYQERVPLQLLDFAYRYTSGILSDAIHLAAEGYVLHPGKEGSAKAQKDGDLSVSALRLATSARLGYQFSAASLPKETLLEMAADRNRVRLPQVDKNVGFGVRLPHERFVMTGQGWRVPEEWEEDEDLAGTGVEGSDETVQAGMRGGDDEVMGEGDDDQDEKTEDGGDLKMEEG